MNRQTKTYLGDGVFVSWDGQHLVLTAENGVEVQNVIYLDQSVYSRLTQFVEQKLGGPTNNDQRDA